MSIKYQSEKSMISKLRNHILMKKNYKNTKKELTNLLKNNKNLSYQEWNDYAYKNGYFSSIVIMDHENVNKWEELVKKLT